MKETAERQLRILARNAEPILAEVVSGFVYDPGHSDLDNDQPIHVRMTLGAFRAAGMLLTEVRKVV